MIEQVEAALQRRDYRTAKSLLEKLAQKQPDSPFVKLYSAKLQETSQHFDLAEQVYRHLLQTALEPKILQEARQGIARIKEAQTAQIEKSRAAALAATLAAPAHNYESTANYLLILEPINNEIKAIVAPKFAQIMKLDSYTAQMHLPGRSWRLYRVGSEQEINFYVDQFALAKIPAFGMGIESLKQPQVMMIRSIEQFSPRLEFTTTDNYGSESSQRCAWADIKTIVTGLLPIFEEITEKTQTVKESKTRYRTQILDYVQVCDLHLPSKNIILRLCSQHYNFQKDLDPSYKNLQTSRESWQRIIDQVQEQAIRAQTWKDFTPFANTALEYPEVLKRIPAHLNIIRRQPSLWDPAFQIYSTAILQRSRAAKLAATLN
jgi:hypothetical protein